VQLQELIDNLLNLSQVESGTLPVRRAPVALERLVQDVLRKLRSSASDLRVQTELDAHLPLIFVDPRRIEQVLLNLLDNARKFSPPGSLITIRARPAGEEVLLSVSDEGPGIPPAERERVFERFYQVDRPGRRPASGTGLGLTICRALVAAHGGRIWVDAAPGGGTTVYLTLPMATAVEPTVLPTGASDLVRRRTDTLDVLVVDDDPALRRLLERSLSEAGYRVETVAEPESALEAVSHRPPDLILLDLMLPGMDGFTLCQRLREWTRAPIVFLTVRASEKDIVTGLQIGADDYVTKPFRMSELLARIEAVLRRAQPEATADGPACVTVGGLRVDLAQRQVTVEGCEVSLTPTEYRLLAFLIRHAGRVLTHEQILQAVWGPEYHQENHYLWAHITHLRQKIEVDSKRPRYLLTERGVGYRLAGDGASQPVARAGTAGQAN
jgi:DNA-binding response OmpR family regulator